jgi:hypothetical protein
VRINSRQGYTSVFLASSVRPLALKYRAKEEWRNQAVDLNRSDEKAGLGRDAIGSEVIDPLAAQEIKETGNERRVALRRLWRWKPACALASY